MPLPPHLDAEAFRHWRAPAAMPSIHVIDAHTGGEPLRVLIDGFDTSGTTVLERRRDAGQRLDAWRRALMWEPRGHADMYGCVIVPPSHASADFGVLFLHNEGFSTMCGHGIIGVAKVVLETGLLPKAEPETEIRIETPAGPVIAFAEVSKGKVGRVRFRNVPAFVDALDQTVQVPGLGPVRYDLAFGGAYYAFVAATDLDLVCEPSHASQLSDIGMTIKRAIQAQGPIHHPTHPDLGFLYGTIFTGPSANHHSRHVCVFANGEVDRCPTGTGVSARLALLSRRGELEVGREIVIDSILGTTFSGKIIDRTSVGKRAAVTPEIGGKAWITGIQTLIFDPDDPLKFGFFLR